MNSDWGPVGGSGRLSIDGDLMSVFARLVLGLLVLFALALPSVTTSARGQPSSPTDLSLFFLGTSADDDEAADALEQIASSWRDGYVPIFRDLMRLLSPPVDPPPRTAPFDPGRQQPAGRGNRVARDAPRRPVPEAPATRVWRRLARFVADQTGLRLSERGSDLSVIQQWMWAQPYDPHPDYAAFKGIWYSRIDPRFRDFFPPGVSATIRLDEVDWGGVPVNGIPPLVYAGHVGASDDAAAYLDDDDIVFGVAINDETRAFPQRILAWHEMALDTLGGVELTIVYCTLCGTVIPYESVVDGEHITFGTSGLLYRSNKLMFDHETNSLWNTFEGVPVVGPRVGSDVQLIHRAVVTTTWEEWRRKHPETSVLSLGTGFNRDYAEGAAYREYFSTDRLMFEVPALDDRLNNKDEVLVLRVADALGVFRPLAIATDYLEDHRLHHLEHAGRQFVVVTSRRGANRVYDAGEVRFTRQLDNDRVFDEDGEMWRVEETALIAVADPTRRRIRQAAQRAFWFGWYAQFPETVLIR